MEAQYRRRPGPGIQGANDVAKQVLAVFIPGASRRFRANSVDEQGQLGPGWEPIARHWFGFCRKAGDFLGLVEHRHCKFQQLPFALLAILIDDNGSLQRMIKAAAILVISLAIVDTA